MAAGLFKPADILDEHAGSTLEGSKHSYARIDLVLGTKRRGVVIVPLEISYARHTLGCSHNCILRAFDRVCAFLRSGEIGATMDLQSILMLIISAATGVYLFYALLRPEKF